MQKRVKKIVFLSHFDANLFLFRLPIMHALVNEGWEVIALCPEGDYHHRFVEFGVTHVSYDIDRGSLNPLREIVSIFSITRVLKDLRPDILHTFTVKPNIYGLLAGRAAKIDQMYASVTGLGSFFIERDLKSKIVKKLTLFLYKIVFRYATVVTFQNHDDQNLFIKHNLINKERTRLIKGSGIDTHLWQSHHKKSDGTVHFLFVGRLLKHKGVGEFIQAATTLKKHYKHRVKFVIAGDFYDGNPYGLDPEVLDQAIKADVITFEGWQNDVLPYLQACDVFVLPSYREGLPRTALEAASMSRAIITSDAVGCRECVEEGANGFLVPVGDSHKLAQAMEKFVKKEELIHTMAKASRAKALAEFDVEMIVKAHLKMYKKELF